MKFCAAKKCIRGNGHVPHLCFGRDIRSIRHKRQNSVLPFVPDGGYEVKWSFESLFAV
jgi:hypothetical protein